MKIIKNALVFSVVIGIFLSLSSQLITESTQKQESNKNCPLDTICVRGDEAVLMGWPLISSGKLKTYRIEPASDRVFSNVISFNINNSVKKEFTAINNYPEVVYFYFGFLLNTLFFSFIVYAAIKIIKKLKI